jgi:hypothetical protein
MRIRPVTDISLSDFHKNVPSNVVKKLQVFPSSDDKIVLSDRKSISFGGRLFIYYF